MGQKPAPARLPKMLTLSLKAQYVPTKACHLVTPQELSLPLICSTG